MVRRTVFIVLALAQTAAFAYFMATHVLPYHGQHPLEVALLSLFTILFAWVSLGFWTALSGFVHPVCGRGPPRPHPIGVPDDPHPARGSHGDRHADSQ